MDKYIKCLGDPEGRGREDSRRGEIHICPEVWTGFYQVEEEWQRGQGHSKQKELYVQMYWGIKYASPLENHSEGFPGGAVVENPPANAGHTGSSPGLGRPHMLRSN